MKHKISHDLSPELSKKAAERAMESYSQKLAEYSPKVTWISADKATITFKVKGISLSGNLALVPGAIELELDVPFLLKPFQGRAIDVIDREVREWVGKAKAGEI